MQQISIPDSLQSTVNEIYQNVWAADCSLKILQVIKTFQRNEQLFRNDNG